MHLMGGGRSAGLGDGEGASVHSASSARCRIWGRFLVRSALCAQQAPEQAQVGRVSEAERAELLFPEPADGVVFLPLQVRDAAPPVTRDPHGQVQAGLRIDLVQDGAALNALELGSQFLGYLPPERVLGMLAGQDMTAREVPHVRVPPPPRRPVAQQYPVCPDQDHGNDVVIFHCLRMAGRGAAVPFCA